MKQRILKFTDRLSLKKLFLVILLLCIFADILSFYSIGYYFEQGGFKEKVAIIYFQTMALQGIQLDYTFKEELFQLINMSLYLVIFSFIIVNLFFYSFFYFKKKWAYNYVLWYCLFGVLLSILTAMEAVDNSFLNFIINVVVIILYGVAGLILKWKEKDVFTAIESQGQ